MSTVFTVSSCKSGGYGYSASTARLGNLTSGNLTWGYSWAERLGQAGQIVFSNGSATLRSHLRGGYGLHDFRDACP